MRTRAKWVGLLAGMAVLVGCDRDFELPPPRSEPLVVDPDGAIVAPLGEETFTVSGGVPPYQLGLLVLDSSGAIDAVVSLDPTSSTLTYRAGDIDAWVVDQLMVLDAAGAAVAVRIRVGALRPPLLAPVIPSVVRPADTLVLQATGGSPPYVYRYQDHGNLSGGTLSPEGTYLAGPIDRRTDWLEVADQSDLVVGFSITTDPTHVERATWSARTDLGDGLEVRGTPFERGHTFLSGAHVRVGQGGGMEATRFPIGTILDVGDFTGDGIVDSLVRTDDAGLISLYIGTPANDAVWAGGFSAAVLGAVLTAPGQAPLVVTSGSTCDVGFTLLPDFLTGRLPTCVGSSASPWAFVRVDSDLLAIVRGNTGTAATVEYLRYGSGVLEPPHSLCTFGTGEVGHAAAVDLDGDGTSDVAFLVDDAGSTMLAGCLYRSGAAGGLVAPIQTPHDLRETRLFGGPRRFGAQSVPQSVLADSRASRALYQRGTSGLWEQLPLDPTLDRTLGGSVDQVLATGDADLDGAWDLLGLDDLQNLVLEYGDEAGALGATNRFAAGPLGGPFVLHSARVDGDARDDVVATTLGHARLLGGTIIDRDGDGNPLPLQPALSRESDDSALAVYAGLMDYDGDGTPDLWGVTRNFDLAVVPYDPAARGFGSVIDLGFPFANVNIMEPSLADIDGDGGPIDIIGPGGDGELADSIVLIHLTAPGTPPTSRVIRSIPLVETEKGIFTDADGDGIVDAALWDECDPDCGAVAPYFYFFRGQGTGASYDLVLDSGGSCTVDLSTLAPGPGTYLADPSRGRILRLTIAGGRIVVEPITVGATCAPLPALLATLDTGVTDAEVETARPPRLVQMDTTAQSELVVEIRSSSQGSFLAILSLDSAGDPTGTVTSLPLYPPLAEGTWTLADLDGDGLPEVVTVSGAASQTRITPIVHVRHNLGGLQFAP